MPPEIKFDGLLGPPPSHKPTNQMWADPRYPDEVYAKFINTGIAPPPFTPLFRPSPPISEPVQPSSHLEGSQLTPLDILKFVYGPIDLTLVYAHHWYRQFLGQLTAAFTATPGYSCQSLHSLPHQTLPVPRQLF